MEQEKLAELEKGIEVEFKNKDHLLQALTHRSYLNENTSWHLDHNERLEFLGDAVLELSVTRYLYDNYPNPEGELTNWRAALVNSIILAKISKKFDLNNYLLLSRGEAKDTGRARQYILANVMEAIIGAIYIDSGYDVADGFIKRFVIEELPLVLKYKKYKDAKSLFQEEAQENVNLTPNYNVLEEWGLDHDKSFRVGVYLGEEFVAEGSGHSKQEAQQEAAHNALGAKGWPKN